jgi:hypothetical protein
VHIFDALRLSIVWKYGGFNLDLDRITIKSLKELIDYPGDELQNVECPGYGMLNFPKTNLIIKNYIDDFTSSRTCQS